MFNEKFFFFFFLKFVLISVTTRVLSILLVFELLILKIFLALIWFSWKFDQSFCLGFLVIIVSEAAMGLSLLVSLIRIGSIEKILGFV